MPVVPTGKRSPLVKPRVGTGINWAHPLARGLVAAMVFNEQAGYPINLVTGAHIAPGYAGAPATEAWGQRFGVGSGFEYVGGGSGPNTYAALRPTTTPVDRSTFAVFSLDVMPSGGSGMSLASITDTSGSSFAGVLSINSTGNARWYEWDGTSKTATTAAANPYVVGTPGTAGGTSQSGSVITAYLNGQASATTAVGTLATWSPTALTVGRPSVGWEVMDGVLALAMGWARALTSDEMAWLHAEPYAWMQTPPRVYTSGLANTDITPSEGLFQLTGIAPTRRVSETAISFTTDSPPSRLYRASGAAPTAGPYTIMFWVRMHAENPGHYQPFLMQMASPTSYGNYFFVGLDPSSSPSKFRPDRLADSNDVSMPMPPTVWVHLAVTSGNAANTGKVYKDGVDVTSNPFADWALTVDDYTIIAGDPDNLANWSDIGITALKTWDAQLSQAEVVAEMPYYAPQRLTNVWAWWSLRNTTTEEIADRSGNGRDWTAVGTITTELGPPLEWGELELEGVLNTRIMPPTGSVDGATLRHP